MSEQNHKKIYVYSINELATLRHDRRANVRCLELETPRGPGAYRDGISRRGSQKPRYGYSASREDRKGTNENIQRKPYNKARSWNDPRSAEQSREIETGQDGDYIYDNRSMYNQYSQHMMKSYCNSPFVDLLAFPPGSSIVRIGPGIPIPKGAIPIPFSFEEAFSIYSQQNQAREKRNQKASGNAADSKSKSSQIDGATATHEFAQPIFHSSSSAVIPPPYQVVPTQNSNMTAMHPSKYKDAKGESSSGSAGYTPRFRYDPDKPANKNNPYSVTGFFPASIRNNSEISTQNRKTSDTQNSATSLNDTESSTTLDSSCDSYNIQIQIPSVS